jgi:hypothetical protein
MKSEFQKIANLAGKKYFVHCGIPGTVDKYGFVKYGGSGFQKEAATGSLREKIDNAK